jgi:hypothetical protein
MNLVYALRHLYALQHLYAFRLICADCAPDSSLLTVRPTHLC